MYHDVRRRDQLRNEECRLRVRCHARDMCGRRISTTKNSGEGGFARDLFRVSVHLQDQPKRADVHVSPSSMLRL